MWTALKDLCRPVKAEEILQLRGAPFAQDIAGDAIIDTTFSFF